jgi:hypothetical protein
MSVPETPQRKLTTIWSISILKRIDNLKNGIVSAENLHILTVLTSGYLINKCENIKSEKGCLIEIEVRPYAVKYDFLARPEST